VEIPIQIRQFIKPVSIILLVAHQILRKLKLIHLFLFDANDTSVNVAFFKGTLELLLTWSPKIELILPLFVFSYIKNDSCFSFRSNQSHQPPRINNTHKKSQINWNPKTPNQPKLTQTLNQFKIEKETRWFFRSQGLYISLVRFSFLCYTLSLV
jgi:hypothetical protein